MQYYNSKIKITYDTEKLFWDPLLEFEISILFASDLWNEAINFCRVFVLHKENVTWISTRLNGVKEALNGVLQRSH